jgi:hypothetical protein
MKWKKKPELDETNDGKKQHNFVAMQRDALLMHSDRMWHVTARIDTNCTARPYGGLSACFAARLIVATTVTHKIKFTKSLRED